MPTNPLLRLFGQSPFKPLQEHMRVVVRCAEEVPGLFQGWRLYHSFDGVGAWHAVAETLKTVKRVTRKGATINTFMLDDAPELVGFVEPPCERR